MSRHGRNMAIVWWAIIVGLTAFWVGIAVLAFGEEVENVIDGQVIGIEDWLDDATTKDPTADITYTLPSEPPPKEGDTLIWSSGCPPCKCTLSWTVYNDGEKIVVEPVQMKEKP